MTGPLRAAWPCARPTRIGFANDVLNQAAASSGRLTSCRTNPESSGHERRTARDMLEATRLTRAGSSLKPPRSCNARFAAGRAGHCVRPDRRRRARACRTRLAHHRPDAGDNRADGSPAIAARRSGVRHRSQQPAGRLDAGNGPAAPARGAAQLPPSDQGIHLEPGIGGLAKRARCTRPTSCRTADSFW